MRYRPLGRSGSAISAVTLTLDERLTLRGPEAGRDLVYAALEQGVNAFHMASPDPVVAELLGQALSSVDRRLVVVSCALGEVRERGKAMRDFSAPALTGCIDRVLAVSGLGQLDMAVLNDPSEVELAQTTLEALKAQRAAGRVAMLGVMGESPAMDAYVSTGAFDVLFTPLHVNSSWRIKHRMRMALERDMAVLAYGWYPEELRPVKKGAPAAPTKRGLFGLGAKAQPVEPEQDFGPFAFLHRTNGWSAEDLCLAYALTEPAVSSALATADDAARIEAMAAVPEREIPPAVPAQIEMARVMAGQPKAASA
ncbi:aldo/keto reductase [Brevundimonas sp. 2R-24]|uniref:Aldo/keto reductase n=1 Tax=Peiella sedimenti TaxID=3061083 RepID=A0ABT8SI08_9CAUL|nr:aldo/keto reductase [Caulobacteraceae bacterium XZ-24]